MRASPALVFLLGSILAAASSTCQAPPENEIAAKPSDLERALSWLPAETEVILVARRPEIMDAARLLELQTQLETDDSPETAFSYARLLPLWMSTTPLGFESAPWFPDGAEVDFCVTALRDFHQPEGAEANDAVRSGVIKFQAPLDLDSAPLALKVRFADMTGEPDPPPAEWVELSGTRALRVSFTAEPHAPSLFAFAVDTFLLWAVGEAEAVRLVARSQRSETNTAPALWRNAHRQAVPPEAPLWILRRYDPEDAEGDASSPLPGARSSPYGKSASHVDDGAAGFTLWFDAADLTMTVLYSSSKPDGAEKLAGEWRNAALGVEVEVGLPQDGTTELRFTSDTPESLFIVSVFLMGLAFFP